MAELTNLTIKEHVVSHYFCHSIENMEESTLSIVIAVLALLVALFALFGAKEKTAPAPAPVSTPSDFNSMPLKLQAYERLVIFCERIALPNLIGRINQPGLSATEMRYVLVENIKQEYEHNTSQQIYVSQSAWEAVRNLRDQNLLIINTISKTMGPDASGSDLNKGLLEIIMQEESGALHTITLDMLNSEAKKIM